MTPRPNRRIAMWALGGMLAATAAGVAGRPRRIDATFADTRLDVMFPARFGEWIIDPDIVPLLPNPHLQQVIAETYDQTLARTYRTPRGERIMLSVAYGGHQREDMNTHRPEICYPAQGMSLRRDSWRDTVAVGNDHGLPVHRLVAGHGSRNEPITYWLVVGRQVADFGLEHKWVTMKYGLTGKIPDGMLIRVSSIDDDEPRSFKLQDRFLRELLQAMAPQDRQRVLGVLG